MKFSSLLSRLQILIGLINNYLVQMSGENSGSFPECNIKLLEIVGSVLSTKVQMRSFKKLCYCNVDSQL